MAVYFASDFHLGLNHHRSSKEREKLILEWIDFVRPDMTSLYLLGDVFDYWFEYKKVVPKGHVRFIGKLAELVDQGIDVHLFTGNHDLWMFDYLEEELGVKIYRHATHFEIENTSFFIGHGDGLGPGDKSYKVIKKIFSNKLNQWLFSLLHPDLGMKIMQKFSQRSREKEMSVIDFMGPEKEWLVQYAEKKNKEQFHHFYIFGHRHLPIDYTLSNDQSRYVNIGDWLNHFSYARFDNGQLELLKFNPLST